MLILLALLGCSSIQSCGGTQISCQNPTPHCGEQVEVICNGDKTNIFDICVEPYGCHKYERTSYPLASLGPVELNLTEAIPDRSNYLWSTFQIKAVVRFIPPVTDSINISCTDGLTLRSLLLARKKTNCIAHKKTMQIKRSKDIEISWQHPNCKGWSHVLSYNVTHCHDSGCVQHQFQNNTRRVKLASYNSTRHLVEIIAMNNCLESTKITDYFIEATDVTFVNNMSDHSPKAGRTDNSAELRIILAVVITMVTIITAIVACLLGVLCALISQRDCGEYEPRKKEK